MFGQCVCKANKKGQPNAEAPFLYIQCLAVTGYRTPLPLLLRLALGIKQVPKHCRRLLLSGTQTQISKQ